MNILIENCLILTMQSCDEKVFRGSIGIVHEQIAFVGEVSNDFKADLNINGENHLIMPGLINAHTHMAMSLLRNYADDLPLMEWLNDKIWPIEANLSSEDVFEGTMLSIAELIRGGCTTFRDMYFFTEEVAKATEISGLRANLGLGLVGVADPDYKLFDRVHDLYDQWHDKANGRIRVEVAPHAPYTCSDAYLRRASQEAQSLNVPLHIHLSESRFEVAQSIAQHGVTPIEHMASLGVFDARTSAAHCVHLQEKDFEILKEHDVSVLYNPSSNLKLGNGFAKVSQMIEKGINVALGTDGSSSNNNLNMFEEIHLGALVNKGIEENPTVLPAYKMLEIATVGGAKALGIDHLTGTLTVGKKADLIMVDLNKPHLTPLHDPVAMLVYSVSGSDVSHVFCNGQMIMENYKILTFDEASVIEKATLQAKKLIEKSLSKGQ